MPTGKIVGVQAPSIARQLSFFSLSTAHRRSLFMGCWIIFGLGYSLVIMAVHTLADGRANIYNKTQSLRQCADFTTGIRYIFFIAKSEIHPQHFTYMIQY